MRQRITYLFPRDTGIDPKDIKFDQDHFNFADVKSAAEERRITIGLIELPQELQTFLDAFHELHLRLTSVRNYNASSPAFSRTSPGLHAFLTPRTLNSDTGFCRGLKSFFGDDLKCQSDEKSLSKPAILSERFTSSSTFQFYHGPLDLNQVTTRLKNQICPSMTADSPAAALCRILSAAGTSAYVDVDFDAISHTVTVVVFWPSTGPRAESREYLEARKTNSEDRLEVGVLKSETADEEEELSLGGYLTVLGESDHPGATLFSFPARHHPLPPRDSTTFDTRFQMPTGLHPKVDIILPRKDLQPPKGSCALHAYWALPSSLFIDRYQFSDPLFLESQNLVSLRSLSGEQDLEAPDWTINRWGSAALFELAAPLLDPIADSQNLTVTIPTHLRYLRPQSRENDHIETSIPWPAVFWACKADQGLKMSTNPFDRANLGYDGLFGPKTMFYHIPPVGGRDLVEKIDVPTISLERTNYVPIGTMFAVSLGFGWVCWQLFGRGASGTATEKGKVKSK